MLKKMKLAPKLALIIGTVLALALVILTAVILVLSYNSIHSATYDTLEAISNANSLQIQQVFDAAETVAVNMQGFLENMYAENGDDPVQTEVSEDPAAAALCQSSIYKRTLSSLNYDIEVYLRESARSAAQYNDDLAGVGVMFEPYKFQSDMRDYAFYISEENANEDVTPFGVYSEYSQEAYYAEAANTRKSLITEAYSYNGVLLVTYANPLIYNNELLGVCMGDINVSRFDMVDATNDHYPSMYATIYDDEGKIIYDSEDIADVGRSIEEFTPVASELAELQEKMARGEAFNIETTREDGRRVTRFFTPIAAAGETWWSLTAVATNEINAAVQSTLLWVAGLSLLALLLIVATIILVLRKMLKPVNSIVAAAAQIAEGQLSIELAQTSEDEIGELAGAFMKMTQTLQAMVNDVQYQLGEMAHGNFDVRSKSEESYVGDYAAFKQSIDTLNSMLSDAMRHINETADLVSQDSEQMSTGAQTLSHGAMEQASSIQELAATVNEISEQVNDTAKNAADARAKTAQAGELVNISNNQMHEMVNAMNEISDKSDQIGRIIKAIEDIAFQTNILALNAAVEAARAGAAGKGFAVVADEVRSLAGKSAEASKNTGALIADTVQAIGRGTDIAAATAESLNSVVESTQGVVTVVDKIAKAADHQSQSVTQITQGIEQISDVVQTTSATAQESAASSEELSGQAQTLKGLVSRFRLRSEGTDGAL